MFAAHLLYMGASPSKLSQCSTSCACDYIFITHMALVVVMGLASQANFPRASENAEDHTNLEYRTIVTHLQLNWLNCAAEIPVPPAARAKRHLLPGAAT